tara:strand:+ start:69 stop:584 length:516 start_codon:yes stop_codon:yes gene_type:complete
MSTLSIENIQHTNGTSAATINSNGTMLQPNIPFVICNCSGYTGGNITPSGYSGLIPWKNIISSRGIVLDTSTYLWTVPITGLYHISAAVRLNANYNYTYWAIDDRTGSPTAVQDNKLVIGHGGGTTFTTAVGSVLLTLETGKNYGMRANASSSSGVAISNSQTWMDIHLVG